MNTKNSKTNEPHRFKLDLIDKLNLKNPNKNMALANSSIYYNWKNVKSEYNNLSTNFYLMVHTQFLIFRIILNLSLKHFNRKPTNSSLSK